MIARHLRRLYLILTGLFILLASSGLAWAMQYEANKLPLRTYFTNSGTHAAWDWKGPKSRSETELKELAEFMYLHQLNATYVDIGSVVTITQQSDESKRTTDTKAYENALSQYVTILGKRGISVFASAGDVNWSKPSQRQTPKSLLEFTYAYNNNHPNARLAGFQFDIEAYNQTGFAEASNTEKSLVLTEYLDLVQRLTTQNLAYTNQSRQPFMLGFAIPYWFDNENGNIPTITWQGKTGPTLYHMLDTLNKLPQSDVIVMAYRNAASGNDGIIAHSRTEIDYASKRAPHVRIIIGQEVNDVEPTKITYFNRSDTELSGQVKLVEDEFKRSNVYGGVAINDLAGYLQLNKSAQVKISLPPARKP